MKNTKLHRTTLPCHACGTLLRMLYPKLKRLQEDHSEIMRFILEKREADTVYRSAEYTLDRVGISESTLLRCQRRGEIRVAKVIRGKKYFRDEDVERLRREYWGQE
ncbi:hypothetical protein [Parapedobacter koreensis]|uniref:Uncharacterized protein n=1 Tax=Parapedobacter koreensis TaxID=332977 RepID=A0A1H7TWN8_9SPHI|nr:hypothetical protein [Parapedobacter koreensis]SEL88878.1 hypothetical protein SAMN05421740_112120 [Parapedobacter koreensis]